MLIQRGIMKDFLDGRDGEFASSLLLYLVCHLSCDIDCGERGIVSERQPVGIGGLPILKPCVLFGIAEEKLNLETRVVDEEYLGCVHCQVCAKHNLPEHLGTAPEFCHYYLDFALERLTLDNCAEDGHILPIHRHGLFYKHILSERVYVHLSVQLLLPSTTCVLRSGVEILQHRIIPKTAHHLETEDGCPLDKIVTCKQAVTDENPGDFEKLPAIVKYGSETFCRLVVAFVFHVLKIEWSPSPCCLIKCLGCEKESRITHSGSDLGKAEYLESALGRACTARPIIPYARCLLAGLLHIAMAKGYGCSAGINVHAQSRVECKPVELLLEVLPEAALAGFAVAGHRQEIEFPIYGQYQKHCLDEEYLKTFSYFCSLIECGDNNRTYLVKRLGFIHNSLIFTFKVTKNLPLDQIFQLLILLNFKELNMFYSIFVNLKILTNYCYM